MNKQSASSSIQLISWPINRPLLTDDVLLNQFKPMNTLNRCIPIPADPTSLDIKSFNWRNAGCRYFGHCRNFKTESAPTMSTLEKICFTRGPRLYELRSYNRGLWFHRKTRAIETAKEYRKLELGGLVIQWVRECVGGCVASGGINCWLSRCQLFQVLFHR